MRWFPAIACLLIPAASQAQTEVLTGHNDAARSGQNLTETLLTPANVEPAGFGKLFTIPVDGKVDAQPLYVSSLAFSPATHNVLYVVSEHDSVYALDADTGTPLWQVSLLATGEQTSDDRNCGQVAPEIGITSTPAIDLNAGQHGTMYVVAMSVDRSRDYHQRLHALDLVTGREEFGGPVEVRATYPSSGPQSSDGAVTFDAKQYKERAALLISNGVVYTSWASHCDINPYSAWVIGYNEKTLVQTSVLNMTPNGERGSIWQSGAGPAADGNGNLFFLLANGTFDTGLNSGGFPARGDYGNAFMNLSTASGLAVADYFTMDNTVAESDSDTDLGSGGAMVLPGLSDALGHSHLLAVGAGKDGIAYVVDRANMGKFHSSRNAVYQELQVGGSIFSSPAWFNNTLYYGSSGLPLQAYPYADGAFALTPASESPTNFDYPGATPSISANGSSNGIVWAVENGSPAVLHAYDAANLRRELYNSDQAAGGRDHFGAGNKYITPTIANGKVYVGTTNGVGVFGLLGCAYSIGPAVGRFNAPGGTGQVSVMASDGCSWQVANTSGFVTISDGASGTGSGTVSYRAGANSGIRRRGSLVIAGQTFTVIQGGAVSAGSRVRR